MYARPGLTAEVGWVLERDHFLLHSLPWFCVALALSLWLVFGSCWRMEVSSWLAVFAASQCLPSVGLSIPAVCRGKKRAFIREIHTIPFLLFVIKTQNIQLEHLIKTL